MPFTPFHWGPSSWISLLMYKYLDIPTLLISSVIVDIEPFCVVVFDAPWPAHGFLHTFLGGSIIAVLTSIIIFFLRKPIKKIMRFFKMAQESPFKKILWTSFFGIYLHLLLDAFLYKDMKPFYPLTGNPLLGVFSSRQVYIFCGLSFLVGLALYMVRLVLIKKKLLGYDNR